ERFLSDDGWHAGELVETAERSEFEVFEGERRHGRCSLALAGAHNRANALAGIAAAARAGVRPADAIAALGRFAGVRRRLELRGERTGVQVFDDFAHRPSAIATTRAGPRARVGPECRSLPVLEPRSSTMKLGTMAAQLPASLGEADAVYCYAHELGW